MTPRAARATAESLYKGSGAYRSPEDVVREVSEALLAAYAAGREAESAEALKRARQEARSQVDGAIQALEWYRRHVLDG